MRTAWLMVCGIVADAQAMINDTPRSERLQVPQFADAQQVVPPTFDPIDAGMFITVRTLNRIDEAFRLLQEKQAPKRRNRHSSR